MWYASQRRCVFVSPPLPPPFRQFKFPAGGHDDHRRQLKPLTAVKTTTVKATAGGGAEDEHEHSLFMFRNYNVKPKVSERACDCARSVHLNEPPHLLIDDL